MPYELFWQGPITAFDRYMGKAEKELLVKDRLLYLNGQYTMAAIGQSFGSKSIYPQKPFLTEAKEKREETSEEKSIKLYKNLLGWSKAFKPFPQETTQEGKVE